MTGKYMFLFSKTFPCSSTYDFFLFKLSYKSLILIYFAFHTKIQVTLYFLIFSIGYVSSVDMNLILSNKLYNICYSTIEGMKNISLNHHLPTSLYTSFIILSSTNKFLPRKYQRITVQLYDTTTQTSINGVNRLNFEDLFGKP